MKCAFTGRPYTVYGYKAKQVRDNIHSSDLISAFDVFYQRPRVAEIYNIGGGRFSNCSMLEAIALCEEIVRPKSQIGHIQEGSRRGDHIWWISDVSRFMSHYPEWKQVYDIPRILKEIHGQKSDSLGKRMQKDGKRNVLGVLIDAVDYKEGAVEAILRSAHGARHFQVLRLPSTVL